MLTEILNAWVVPGINESRVSLEIKAVCEVFGVSMSELMKNRRSRKPEYVRPRQFIVFFLRRSGLTFRNCGDFFFQDHSTAMGAVRNIENWVVVDKEIKGQYELINLKTEEYAKY